MEPKGSQWAAGGEPKTAKGRPRAAQGSPRGWQESPKAAPMGSEDKPSASQAADNGAPKSSNTDRGAHYKIGTPLMREHENARLEPLEEQQDVHRGQISHPQVLHLLPAWLHFCVSWRHHVKICVKCTKKQRDSCDSSFLRRIG